MPAFLAAKHDQQSKGSRLKIKEVLADAGYSSSEALKALKEKHVTGYIPLALACINPAEKALNIILVVITTSAPNR